jgi:acetolactate synthase I/II/III large subunit
MTTAQPRLAGHALVEALIQQGVDTVFGVPGESYLAALDGFAMHADRIRFVTCRHEGGAAFMADAYGKLRQRPGVCFVTRGPGATNASIGVHTAFQDSTPMVLLIGQVASDQRDREAFQELDYRQFFGPGTLGMTKWVAEVQDPNRLPEYLARAFRVAMQGRPGPVALALPEDMLMALTDAPVLPRVEPAVLQPVAADLQRWAALLSRAKRPLVIAGGGFTRDGVQALQRWAERWHVPVACGLRWQDTFDNSHAHYAGDVGIGINPCLAAHVRDADLLVALGVRLSEMETSGYTLLQVPVPTQALVHLYPSPDELGRVYTPSLALPCSMAALPAVLDAVQPPSAWVVPWAAHTARVHADYQATHTAPPVAPLDMAQVIKTVQRWLPVDAIYTNGAGNFAGWLHRYLRYPSLAAHGRTQLAPTVGAMGYGFPAAVAAAILEPHRWVVNVAGDGDFLMTSQEMATAMACGVKKLVSLVVDNGSYGTIRMHQEREFPGRVSGSDLHNPDFAALARAYGWAAHTVRRTEDFEAALMAALAADQPTVVHLVLDTNVITSRTSLEAIRAAALARQGAT